MLFLYLAPVLGLLVLEGFFVYKAASNRKRAKLIVVAGLVLLIPCGVLGVLLFR